MTEDERRRQRNEWRRKYLADPAHPERRERKNMLSRECNRRRREAGIYLDDVSLPMGILRMTGLQLERLQELMKGRRYG